MANGGEEGPSDPKDQKLQRRPKARRSATDRRTVLVLSCLLTLYTAVMSFEILFPFGLWVFEPDWLLNHSQLV